MHLPITGEITVTAFDEANEVDGTALVYSREVGSLADLLELWKRLAITQRKHSNDGVLSYFNARGEQVLLDLDQQVRFKPLNE